ncbi:MAG: TetR/AcrR family transcriptional regulator [Thaumarchaeota archaeon]|nr:TetR/AcrR family transcriptional regulator [Nitrososphaerota archaeon]
MPKVVPSYKEEARDRIVQGALEAFSSKGYHETTMDDIAKEIGISKGALYLYFDSKEQLFTEICKSGQNQFGEILNETFSGGDLLSGSEKFFTRMLEENRFFNQGLLFETLTEASRNKEIRIALREIYERSIDTIMKFLNDLKSKRLIRSDVDSRLLAKGLIAIYDGIAASIVVNNEKAEALKTWNAMMRVLLTGVLVRK